MAARHPERVGVLGVGRMGLPIARALVDAGYDVLAYDPVAGRTDGFVAATSAAEVAASADLLVTVLPGTPELEAAMAEALPALRAGGMWIDMTSADPLVVERLARGIEAVGAPMGGGVAAAESRSLSFFVGGGDAAVERARPLLESLGTVDYIGASLVAGYTAKLLANLLWFGQVIAVTEALLLGQSLGVPPATLRRTLAASAGGSVFIDEYLDRLLEGDYLETFGLDRCVEELDSLAALAHSAGVPFELSETVARLHREALQRFGAVDGELLAARLLEDRAGRQLRS